MYYSSYPIDQVNKLYPNAIMIKPMLVSQFSQSDLAKGKLETTVNSGEYFAQIKKDGHLYQFVKGANDDEIYLFSRNESVQTGLLTEKGANVPHIMNALKVVPPFTVLLGEIYYPNQNSNAVTKVMGALPQNALKIQQEEMGEIHFYLFDILYYNGENWMERESWERFNFLSQLYQKFNWLSTNFLEIAQTFEEKILENLQDALAKGEEGIVLKKKNEKYYPDSRPKWVQMKVKKIDYLDCFCIGIYEAEKYYEGKEIDTWLYWETPQGEKVEFSKKERKILDTNTLLQKCYKPITKYYYHNYPAGIKVGVFDSKGEIKYIGDVSSGLDDNTRAELRDNLDKYLYKTCMLKCMEIYPESYTIRHPVFISWREDKNYKECTIL